MMLYDALAQEDAEQMYEAWKKRLDAAQKDIVDFVIKEVGSDVVGEFGGYLEEGSYNICLVVKLNAKPTYVIRFPQPGTTAACFLDEKVRNEVQVMDLLRETTIPIPKVYSWGLTSDSPSQLGPYVIMEYVKGKPLIEELRRPTKTDDGVEMELWKNLGNPRVLHAYSQIADYLLQIHQLDFNAAGGLRMSSSDQWVASERPVTDNMNILARNILNYPTEYFPTTSISSPKAYFEQLADQHLAHLHTQRNAVENREDARRCFIARHRLKQSIDQYLLTDTETSPLKLYCWDLRPSNILVDDDLNVKAVLDFEFCNALPAQFAHDPPWWLTILRPTTWIDNDFHFGALKDRLEPHIEQFLQVMEKKEKEMRGTVAPLSARMRDSWTSNRFWFNLAMSDSWSIDAVYWAALHKPGNEVLDDALKAEMEVFVEMKIKQLDAYKAECKARGI
ncbi:uncharacterized protein J4E78_000861 [Alternaria triticimaculans]|uniref:uncharacterized protein n=1 Tax=Alternaria triticimaculans TaxID=297637 RepID=UPI0020C509DD|nr:uncharacterized protein J4E78_000861 [Alternaria triticimaculans]KAI4672360.1 hypothetical protein J4E78_000861 [Alternaria triticimaculans]